MYGYNQQQPNSNGKQEYYGLNNYNNYWQGGNQQMGNNSGFWSNPGFQTTSFGYNNNQFAQAPLPQERSEFIPIEKSWTEWIPEQKIEYKPVEKKALNYLEIKHQINHIPVQRLQKRIEWIPIERYDEITEYVPVENSHVSGQTGPWLQTNFPPQSQINYPPPNFYNNHAYNNYPMQQYPNPNIERVIEPNSFEPKYNYFNPYFNNNVMLNAKDLNYSFTNSQPNTTEKKFNK